MDDFQPIFWRIQKPSQILSPTLSTIVGFFSPKIASKWICQTSAYFIILILFNFFKNLILQKLPKKSEVKHVILFLTNVATASLACLLWCLKTSSAPSPQKGVSCTDKIICFKSQRKGNVSMWEEQAALDRTLSSSQSRNTFPYHRYIQYLHLFLHSAVNSNWAKGKHIPELYKLDIFIGVFWHVDQQVGIFT